MAEHRAVLFVNNGRTWRLEHDALPSPVGAITIKDGKYIFHMDKIVFTGGSPTSAPAPAPPVSAPALDMAGITKQLKDLEDAKLDHMMQLTDLDGKIAELEESHESKPADKPTRKTIPPERINFKGLQRVVFSDGEKTDPSEHLGKTVVSTGTVDSLLPGDGIDEIGLLESSVCVRLSNKRMEAGVFGILVDVEPKGKRLLTYGPFECEAPQDTPRVIVATTGTCSAWVSNQRGKLNIGELLTTESNGYCTRQGDTIVRSHTIGKSLIACDFVESHYQNAGFCPKYQCKTTADGVKIALVPIMLMG